MRAYSRLSRDQELAEAKFNRDVAGFEDIRDLDIAVMERELQRAGIGRLEMGSAAFARKLSKLEENMQRLDNNLNSLAMYSVKMELNLPRILMM